MLELKLLTRSLLLFWDDPNYMPCPNRILVGDTKRVSCTVLIFGKFTTPEINTQNIFTWKMILNLRLSLNFHCLDRAKCYFQAWGMKLAL